MANHTPGKVPRSRRLVIAAATAHTVMLPTPATATPKIAMITSRRGRLARRALGLLFAATLSAVVGWPAAATASVTRAAPAQDASLARAVDRYSAHLGITRHSLARIVAADLPPNVV